MGNIGYVGEMDWVTEGSVLIKEILLDDKPGPAYVQVWGGTNTLARALKCIEEEYKGTPQWQDIYDKIIDKTIVYIILDQYATYLEYILPNWPDIKTIYNRSQFGSFAYSWKSLPKEFQAYMDGEWHAKNIKFNRGPLLERYYLMGDGQTIDYIGTGTHVRGNLEWARERGFYQYDFISEGDSPSFFYLLDFEFGLRNVEDLSYGGLGGRFVQSGKNPGVWADRWEDVPRVSDFNPYFGKMDANYPLARWIPVLQNDFAARAEWGVKDYKEANHSPVVKLNHANDITQRPVIRFD